MTSLPRFLGGEVVLGLDHRAAGDGLEAGPLDIAGGERPFERVRGLAGDGNDLLRGQRGAVERPPRHPLVAKSLGPALAKDALAADIERHLVAHAVAEAVDESLHPAVMVAVGVAQDQPVKPRGIDVEEFEIAAENLRRVAEIQHVLGALAG